VDKVIPVDVYVTGCAARPEAIIDGVITSLGILEKKKEAYTKAQKEKKAGKKVIKNEGRRTAYNKS